jgi:uncharacterized membrane protein YdbT with pleckstrin-like domain
MSNTPNPTDPSRRVDRIEDSTPLQSEFQPKVPLPQEPEHKLWEGGYSPKAMYGTWLTLGVLSIAAIVALILLPILGVIPESKPLFWGIAMAAIATCWIIGAILFYYRRWSMHYELTTQRFIHTQGILTRTTDRIDVIDIDDVAYTQGIVQRMLGVGTIRLVSKDRSHPQLNLLGIDQVARVSGMIDDVRRKERRKRSLHIDAS